MMPKLIRRWLTNRRCRRAGVPRELWGLSNEWIPAEEWGGWRHAVIHE